MTLSQGVLEHHRLALDGLLLRRGGDVHPRANGGEDPQEADMTPTMCPCCVAIDAEKWCKQTSQLGLGLHMAVQAKFKSLPKAGEYSLPQPRQESRGVTLLTQAELERG